jgi:hypothetical protein
VDRNTVWIAIGFAALAALFVSIGFRGEERRVEAQVERARGQLEASPEAAGTGLRALGPDDRLAIAFVCSLGSLAAYLWILVRAFRESPGWGLAVLFGNAAGAVAFTVLHPRQSLLPLVLMFGGLGVSWAARFTGA